MTTPTSSERGLDALPGHIHGFALMHMAMRRDARRLGAAAPTLDPGGGVAGWWQQLRRTIEWHHRSEDDMLWPEMRCQVPGFAHQDDVLEDDHAALDEAMDAVSAALVPSGDRAALVAAAARFDNLIHDHLRREEAIVFPAFATGLPVAKYLAIERRVIGSAGFGLLTFVLPWMFDGFSGRAAGQAGATIPPPIRLLGATVLRRRYRQRWRQW